MAVRLIIGRYLVMIARAHRLGVQMVWKELRVVVVERQGMVRSCNWLM